MKQITSRGFVTGYGLVVCALAAGCGGGAASGAPANNPEAAGQPAQADGKPFDIEKALAREADKLSDVAVSGPKGAWSATVPAAGKPTLSMVEGIAVVEI